MEVRGCWWRCRCVDGGVGVLMVEGVGIGGVGVLLVEVLEV